MPSTDNSPSHARRQALRQADARNSIRVLDSFPLSKYFDIAQRLLHAFQEAVDKRRLDEAYVYGLRYAAFGVEALPKHKDWRGDLAFAQQKRRNAKQVEKVISMMEIIKQRMDAEEMVVREKRRVENEERERQLEESRREVELRSSEQEKLRREEETETKKKSQVELLTKVEQSAMAKLLAMQNQISDPLKKESTAESHDSESAISSVTLSSTLPNHMGQNHHVTGSASSFPATNASVSATLISSSPSTTVTPSTKANSDPRTPRSSNEQRTIEMLEATIVAQEKRLEQIENFQIPTLVRLAKEHLLEGQVGRPTALKLVARKRSLERELDVIKAAIFNMETQMFMLENAMEDRQVQKALDEASNAMKSFPLSIGGNSEAEATHLSDLATLLSISVDLEIEETDIELLRELQEWMSAGCQTKEAKVSAMLDDDEISILSMPHVPAAAFSDNKALLAATGAHKSSSAVLSS